MYNNYAKLHKNLDVICDVKWPRTSLYVRISLDSC